MSESTSSSTSRATFSLTKAEFVDFNLFYLYRRAAWIPLVQAALLILIVTGDWLVFDSTHDIAAKLAVLELVLVAAVYFSWAAYYSVKFRSLEPFLTNTQWTLDEDGIVVLNASGDSFVPQRIEWSNLDMAQDLGDFYFFRSTTGMQRRLLLAKRGFGPTEDLYALRSLINRRADLVVRRYPVIIGREPRRNESAPAGKSKVSASAY